jgi:hypothetical protein
MVRQRKDKHATSNDIPLAQPGSSSGEKTTKPLVEIPEEEQWRLLNESGIFKKISKLDQKMLDASVEEQGAGGTSFGEQVLDTVLYVIPFSFLLIMMDMCVNLGI